jgi:allantoinase
MIVQGAQVVTPDGLQSTDIFVEDGRFSTAASGPEIDATGLTMLPGLIDVHVHFNEPGRADWEGAATGSRALAAGGGTTFFDMPLNSSPCTTDARAFREKRAALERASVTDFGLWGGIVPGNRDEMAELAACGVVGFKAFMADSGLPEFPRSDDLTLYRGMEEAARLGLPVAVHAETNELIRPSTGPTVRDYLESRPILAELTAIRRAIALAEETGCKLHIVHVSSGRGVLAAVEGRQRGVDVSVETCAHYLYFGEDDMERLGPVLKCAPPLRDAAERKALWRAVTRGDIDIVASDHSPALPTMKQGANFSHVWGGVAGVQSTLAVLLDLALPERVAALAAANPAARFGLANKGRISPGWDADFTLVDLNAEYTVTRESLFQRHGFSPYLGATFRGVVRRTVVRGRNVYLDGEIVAEGGGQFIHAQPRIHA